MKRGMKLLVGVLVRIPGLTFPCEEGEEMMREENTEELEVLEAQIKHLQAEVKGLQQQLQEEDCRNITFNFEGPMKEALACMCGLTEGEGKEVVVSKLEEEVEQLERKIKLQTQINGISVTRCITKTLDHSGRKEVQLFCISGHCSGLDFQVEFKLSEVQEHQRTVNELNVVLDSKDPQSFSSFLSRVEENNNLLLFFRTLRTFSDRCADRTRAFQHFQEKFPSVVSLPGGCRSEVMRLSHPELSGCVFFVYWSFEVSTEGAVILKIHLLPKIPEQALQFYSQPAGGAAEAFQSLLRTLGPEATIESVIRGVGLLPDAEPSS
uniref:Centromere protein P n=1 Tax=Nothobranchius kadleci TaxID=1051664 RepID=A0A1A8BVG1_NOTKA